MSETIINDLPENILSQLSIYEEKLQTIHKNVESRLKEIDENISLSFQSLREQAGIDIDTDMDLDQMEDSSASTETQSHAVSLEDHTTPESEETHPQGEYDTDNPKNETNQEIPESLPEQDLEALEAVEDSNEKPSEEH